MGPSVFGFAAACGHVFFFPRLVCPRCLKQGHMLFRCFVAGPNAYQRSLWSGMPPPTPFPQCMSHCAAVPPICPFPMCQFHGCPTQLGSSGVGADDVRHLDVREFVRRVRTLCMCPSVSTEMREWLQSMSFRVDAVSLVRFPVGWRPSP